MTTLYKHQKNLVDYAPPRHALVWETGTGKSLAAIELAIKTDEKVLFICPKSLKSDWEKRVQEDPRTGGRRVYTKEEFRRDWDKIPEYPCVVVDEAHYFFGMKSAMSKSLEKYFKKWKTEYRYFLTATAYRSSPWDIYRMCQLLGKTMSYPEFFNKFFYHVQMGSRQIPMVRKGIEGEIAKLVAQVGSTVKLEDCVDVPDQIFETEYFELTKEQKKAIGGLTDPMPIVRYTAEHQIAGGTLKSDGYTEDQVFQSDKFDRLMDITKDNERLIVVCRYNNELEHIRGSIKDIPVYLINGSVSGEERHAIINEVNGSKRYVLLLNAACSEGFEVPACPLMVFYSYSFSLKDYIQMRGRILRINALKKNLYLSLVTRRTIDEDIFETVTVKKQDFHLAIYKK